jgi:hypothetical protein
LLLLNVTVRELVLVPVIPTVQMVDPLLVTVEGAQDKLLNCAAEAEKVKPIVADLDTPFADAVTFAWSFALRVAVVAEKLALVDPDGIVTLDGTVNEALSLESAMLIVAFAALFKETMQIAEELLPRLVGEQDSDESCAGALAVRVKV